MEKQGSTNDEHNVNMVLHNMNLGEKEAMFFRDPMEHLIELLTVHFWKNIKGRKRSVGKVEINFTETQNYDRLPFVVLLSGHSNPLFP